MFDFKNFILKTLKGMVGNEADYKIRARALGWSEKDALTVDDLAEIDALIDAQYLPEEAPAEEESV